MKRSAYIHEEVGPFIVAVTDLNGGVSVTNDIENVVADLVKAGHDFKCKRLIYCDSEGHWDGVCVVENKFSRFVPLGRSNKEEAANAALHCFDW